MNLSDPNNGPAKTIPLLPAASQLAHSSSYAAPAKWVPAEMADENPTFSLMEYWEAICRYKFAILGFIAAGAMGALILSFLQTPLYRAHTTLEVEDLNENFQNLKDSDPTAQVPAAESYFQTQVKILQSREMVELVIDKLGLMQRMAPHKHFWSGLLHPTSTANPALEREQVVE